MVRPGGVLQYSTCTLNPAENEAVTERFLNAHPEYEPLALPESMQPLFEPLKAARSYRLTLFPPVHGCDGFFIASFRKKG